MIDLKELLLQAPEGQIDSSALESIKKWDEIPKPIQILETLDKCVGYGLASGFSVKALQIILYESLKKEGVTLEELTKQVTWREGNKQGK